MHKKTIIAVFIHCETPLDSEEILHYFSPYQDAIKLYIDNPKTFKNITIIPPIGYSPMATMTLDFFIRSKKELYRVLAKLILIAVQYLIEINHHKSVVELTITLPKITRYHRFYSFQWKLDH